MRRPRCLQTPRRCHVCGGDPLVLMVCGECLVSVWSCRAHVFTVALAMCGTDVATLTIDGKEAAHETLR